MQNFIEKLTVIEELTDNRQQWKVKHKLKDIVFIVLVATIANADEWFEMEIFAKHNEQFFKQYIDLENGIPSHDTIRRVMALINPAILQNLVNEWHELICQDEKQTIQKLIHIDGKTVRGNNRKGNTPAHIVSAYCSDDGYTIGQTLTDEKSNEITAIPELLKKINIKGNVVTIDAIGCQTEIAKIIKKDNKADYILAVKENQKNLYEDIKDYFYLSEAKEQLKTSGCYLRTFEKAHGQLETREYYQSSDIGWLYGKQNWHGLKTIGMVETTIVKNGKKSVEQRYFISSLALNIELFSKAVRSHWSIEAMHWLLDVTFKEDANTTINKTAVMNQNIIRKWALSILKHIDTILGKKYSLKAKRYAMSLDPFGNLARALEI